MVLHGGRGSERVWGHKSVQLPPSPDGRTTDAYRSAFVLSFAIPGLIQTCCTLACLRPLRLVLVVRFLSIVGGMGERGENFAKLLQPTLAKGVDQIIRLLSSLYSATKLD